MFYGRINRSRPRITGRRTDEYLRSLDKTKYYIIITHVELVFRLYYIYVENDYRKPRTRPAVRRLIGV